MPCRPSRVTPATSPSRVTGGRPGAALLLACAALVAPVGEAAAADAAPPPAVHDHGAGAQADLPHSHSHLPQGLQLFAFLSAGISHQDSNDAQDIDGQQGLVEGALLVTYARGPFRFLAEAGHDQVKPENGGDKLNMTKLTAALAASAGKEAGSRPTVRLFVTHAVWNEAARLNLSGNTKAVFGDKKAGTSVGVQAETWW